MGSSRKSSQEVYLRGCLVTTQQVLSTLRGAVKGQTPSELLLSLLGNGTPVAAPPAHLAEPAGTMVCISITTNNYEMGSEYCSNMCIE